MAVSQNLIIYVSIMFIRAFFCNENNALFQ